MKKSAPVHYVTLTDEERKKIEKKDLFSSISQVVFGTIIYTFALVWILQLCGFFAGGMSGVSQLIIALTVKFGHNEAIKTFLSENLGTLIILLNIPLLIFGWRGVSKKFAILTLVSLILQFIFSNLLSKYTISPFVFFVQGDNGGLIEFLKSGSKIITKASDPENVAIVSAFKEVMLPGTRIVFAIFGGILCAVGCAMCLRGGGSTGGMDIVANYLYSKKNISFTSFQTVFDTSIIVASSLISVETVLYTLIRLYVYMITLRQFYKSYNTNRIEIVTEKPEEVRNIIIQYFHHSVTIYKCIGGFTKTEKYTIVAYTNEFETKAYLDYIKDIDENAFITVASSKIERSFFIHKTI